MDDLMLQLTCDTLGCVCYKPSASCEKVQELLAMCDIMCQQEDDTEDDF